MNFLTIPEPTHKSRCQKRKQKEKSEARALDPNNVCNDELFFQAAQQAAPRQAEEVYDS